MEFDTHTELVEQLDWHWREHARPRLDGLSDVEYLWQPVPGCWSIRPRADARTAMAAGAGEYVADFEYPEPTPAPFTTIAWRMAHLSVGVFGMRASNHFGDGSVTYETTDWPITAVGGLELLDHAYGRWMAGIRALDPGALDKPCGPAEGPFADAPFGALILHINREGIHHLAEITLLRDLFAH
jgi:hypothetical protein